MQARHFGGTLKKYFYKSKNAPEIQKKLAILYKRDFAYKRSNYTKEVMIPKKIQEFTKDTDVKVFALYERELLFKVQKRPTKDTDTKEEKEH